MSADEGQISRVIKSLLDKKLIARTRDPSYGRRKLIRLIKKGERAYELVEAIQRSREERLLDNISKKEYRRFLDTFEKISANANELLDESERNRREKNAPLFEQ